VAKVETLDVKPDTRVAVASTTPISAEGVDISAATKLVSVAVASASRKT